MTPEEREGLRSLAGRQSIERTPHESISLSEAVDWAEEHLFDRNSVVLECQIWQEALGRARGSDFPVSDLKRFTGDPGYLRDAERPGEVTTREVLMREWEIVQLAKEGLGDLSPLISNPEPAIRPLDREQLTALGRLLGSTNFISVFRGGAGTGKSFVLGELADQFQQGGRPVTVLAPQRQQVDELAKAGFPAATAVASFITKPQLAERAVVIVDEAGQLGGRQMLVLLRLAKARNARVILSGDTRQHGAVEASDALMAIERHAGVKPVVLQTIRRQNPALGRNTRERTAIRRYRKAVQAAAAGKLVESFDHLDKLGAIQSCGLGEQAGKLVEEYLRLMEQGASVVVVSQTWGDVNRTNDRIRQELKAGGILGITDVVVQTVERIDLTNAQKRDPRFHPEDSVIIFNQKVREAEAGSTGKLTAILKGGLLVEVGDRLVNVPNKLLDRITVCRPRELPVASGERLQLKANRRQTSGDRVTNGEIVVVKSVERNGDIELIDGRVLDRAFREFIPGYAVTSYGSQGKTVDYVLFSDSTIKAATNAQQWYVTISRGRKGVRIFTPDKEQLRESISRTGHRPLALGLVGAVPPGGIRLWDWLHARLLRFGRRTADRFRHLKLSRRHYNHRETHEHKTTRMLGRRPERPSRPNRTVA